MKTLAALEQRASGARRCGDDAAAFQEGLFGALAVNTLGPTAQSMGGIRTGICSLSRAFEESWIGLLPSKSALPVRAVGPHALARGTRRMAFCMWSDDALGPRSDDALGPPRAVHWHH